MYPLIRVDKRIPDGSIWQARRSYLVPAVDGWARVFGPTGTVWSNQLDRWTARTPGVSIFHPERAFTIACHGDPGYERFYIDIAHRVRIEPDLVEFVDLFLDVMIDPEGVVTEKDEYQLAVLPADLQAFARYARDEVRALIAAGDPLFDRRSRFYVMPDDALALPPATMPLDL